MWVYKLYFLIQEEETLPSDIDDRMKEARQGSAINLFLQ